MGNCPYHGKYKEVEWHDYQCPKCDKELVSFGKWRAGGKADKNTKNLLKRAIK